VASLLGRKRDRMKECKHEWKYLPNGIKYCAKCGTYSTTTQSDYKEAQK
jgi:hypothetical protein